MPQSSVTDMVSAVALFIEILRKQEDHDERLRDLEGRKTARRPQERRTNLNAPVSSTILDREFDRRF